VRRLEADGWDVVALTRSSVDLADPVAGAAAVRAADPDVVYSLAAGRAKATAAERAATVAVNTSPWLVDALPDRCRVVRLGSSTEYAARSQPLAEDAPLEPRGFFGATKAAGSLLLQAAAAERGVRAAVLRAFQVYGPGDHPTRLVPVVLAAARDGGAVPLPPAVSRRDWVWVGDVVDACVRAAVTDALPPGQVLNIGTGVQTSTEELVAAAERATGRSIATAPGAHPGRSWDTADWVCDPRAAADLLGWRPTVALEEGLARTWAAESGTA
jgi:UDP-glucose 4-epimerase